MHTLGVHALEVCVCVETRGRLWGVHFAVSADQHTPGWPALQENSPGICSHLAVGVLWPEICTHIFFLSSLFLNNDLEQAIIGLLGKRFNPHLPSLLAPSNYFKRCQIICNKQLIMQRNSKMITLSHCSIFWCNHSNKHPTDFSFLKERLLFACFQANGVFSKENVLN